MRGREWFLAGLALAVLAPAGTGTAPGARAPRPFADDCGLEPPAVALAAPPVPRRPGELAWRRAAGATPRVRRDGRSGALSGKTVYVSAGHGFTWAPSLAAWRTQRGNTNDIVEDLVSAETIDVFLVDELERMGAHVVTVRESDRNPERVTVDDADATLEGGVVERGAGPAGWGVLPLPLTAQENPFSAGGTREIEAAAAERGRVRYDLDVPAAGEYVVQVAYAQGADRAPDAHYIVEHPGGESHFRVDQRRHGSTWVRLGRFWLEPGQPAAVLVADDSPAAPGSVISLDAVRIGGGVGVIDRGGGVSGRPMWENAARYNAQLSGAPPSVYDYTDTDGADDVGTRSRFAAWDHEAGEDAVYLAWHTNAPDPGRGTESYVYGPNGPPSPLSQFSGVAGSLELQAAVHDELVADLRAAWDPMWRDRGKFSAFFGEVNPNHNPEMPAILVEVGFHDTPADADALRHPRFRRIAARALAQGVARYFATRDGAALTLPPEPPSALSVLNDGAGGLRVAWRPPLPEPGGGDAATGYRVYLSRDGRAFDDGTAVDGESFTITGLAAGDVRYVRVAAVNAGGESRLSPLAGARVAPSGAARVLVVGGFTRLDGSAMLREDLSAYALATVDRMELSRMNDGSHAARHGAAIAAAGTSFDGAVDEAIAAGDVDLRGYQAIDWFVGEESTADEPIGAGARAELAAYLATGGRLFLSGSELAWAMGLMGSAEEMAFFTDALNAAYAGDDAETFAVTPVEGPYQHLPAFAFADDGVGGYLVEFPDQLAPGAGAALALEYSGGAGGGAAIVWGAGAPGERGVLLGFPFETIEGAGPRAEVMAATLAFLEVEADAPLPDAGPGGGGEGVVGDCGCRAGGRGWPPGRAGAGFLLLGLILLARLGMLRSR